MSGDPSETTILSPLSQEPAGAANVLLHASGIENALERDREAFRFLFLSNPLPMWVYDAATLRFLEVNAAAVALYGYSRDEFLRMSIADIRPAEDVPRLLAAVSDANPTFRGVGEWKHRRRDGSTIDVEISAHGVRFDGRDAALVVVHDITSRKTTEAALRESEARYRMLFERNLAGVYRNTLDGRVLACNEACARILGYPSAEAVIGTDPSSAYFDSHERDLLISRIRAERQLTNEELRLRKADGTPVWVLANITLVDDAVIEGTLIDITEKKRAEEQVVYRAYHDSLTGLPNRALFKERLWVMLNHARHHASGMAVMALDIDRFKLINDTLGHSVGDALVREVALRLQSVINDDDLLARAGGDEFLLCRADIEHAEDAARFAENIHRIFQQPFTAAGNDFHLAASAGIAVFPGDGSDAETLLRNADAAMFHAKHIGRNNYQLARPEMTRRANELLSVERGIRRALDQEEFVLFYQPQVDVCSGRVVGLEALVRWRQSDGSLADPSQFIAVAEDTRLIIPLGDWILRNACKQAAAWRRRGVALLRVAVNLSALQFQREDLTESVALALRESGLPPEALDLEITETTAMHDADATVEILRRLKAMRVGVSMDDFGTGHSSLNHLRRFPFDIVKIDQSFVCEIGRGRSSEAIIRAVIAMAHALDLRVIAEGVETVAQLEFLRKEGCEEMQGFLVSHPLAAEAVETFLQNLSA